MSLEFSQDGIEVLYWSLMALQIWLELSRWNIVPLHVSWMTQGGIELFLGSLMALPIRLKHSRWHIVT